MKDSRQGPKDNQIRIISDTQESPKIRTSQPQIRLTGMDGFVGVSWYDKAVSKG